MGAPKALSALTPSLNPCIFSFARISFFGMGEGVRSGFFKKETAQMGRIEPFKKLKSARF